MIRSGFPIVALATMATMFGATVGPAQAKLTAVAAAARNDAARPIPSPAIADPDRLFRFEGRVRWAGPDGVKDCVYDGRGIIAVDTQQSCG
jgi:hypothetical protein